MEKRTTNFSLFERWAIGRSNPIAELSLAIECSTTMARELIKGIYNDGFAPKKIYREKACRLLGHQEDELFPILAEKETA